MAKLELYTQMKNELIARRGPLVTERQALQFAAKRIVEIEEALLAIDEEIAEYDAAIAPLLPPKADHPLDELLALSQAVGGYDVAE